ncbi:methylated-DNA--[protein]-cysteine S-methyltransferase [Paenibacillus sp. FSL R5-0341]|uniref:methylated-DNA--[protein]-cysteine S-methyltransferase n=1 Tax=Paenibacillus sp. FSL R5-0341 TaxID=2921636 RepID=UPI0030D24B7B
MKSIHTEINWTTFTHTLFNDLPVNVAATERGLCLISMPDDTHMNMKEWVVKKFVHANLVEDQNRLSPYVEQLQGYCEGKSKAFDIPLDLQGTKFQISVWQALMTIPYGQIRSYLEIAKMIDHPKAIRAVGSTNGANPIPIVIPCHRVIGKNGTLTGYSGGLKMKEKLLQLEGYDRYTVSGHPRFNF